MIRFGKAVLVMFAAGSFVLGCSDNKKPESARREPMRRQPPMAEPGKSVDRFLEIQAANGARNDATLYPSHFDGGELNALGRSKLALLMHGGRTGQPTVVYLALAHGDAMAGNRHAAVDRYWRESMSSASQLEIRDGINPMESHQAREGLDRMYMSNSNPPQNGAAQGGMTGGGNTPEQTPTPPPGGTGDTLFK